MERNILFLSYESSIYLFDKGAYDLFEIRHGGFNEITNSGQFSRIVNDGGIISNVENILEEYGYESVEELLGSIT